MATMIAAEVAEPRVAGLDGLDRRIRTQAEAATAADLRVDFRRVMHRRGPPGPRCTED